VKAFDVTAGGLAGERVLAEVAPGVPDGIKTDTGGRVYVSSASGVQVFGADGEPAGEIALPGAVNFTWGGPDRDVLYITTDTAVWAVATEPTGA
jgi:gluconolactonase